MSFSHIELFSTIDLFKTNENCFISSIINDSAFFEIWQKSHSVLQVIIMTERLSKSVSSVINESAFFEIWKKPHNVLWIMPFYLHGGITETREIKISNRHHIKRQIIDRTKYIEKIITIKNCITLKIIFQSKKHCNIEKIIFNSSLN